MTAAAGGTTEAVEFDELEPTEVSAIPTYTLTTPGSVDVLDVKATTAMGGQDALIVTGTSDGVAIESLTLFDVTTFTIDTATNDAAGGGTGDDVITISSGLNDGVDIAQNLVNFAIDAGAGGTGDADSVTVNAVIDVPGAVTIDNADTVDVDFDIEAGTDLTISNVDTEVDLAQDVDLTTDNGDIDLATGVTLIDLSGAAGTNRVTANDSPATGDGNISLGQVSDSGTPMALEIDADNAVAVNSMDVQSTISILANQDATGAQGFSQASGTTVATTNDTASAVSITVNTLVGGTGGAALEGISAGTTSGSTGGRVTIATSMGAITDANGATDNITAGNTILTAIGGVGTVGDPIETTASRLEASGGTGGVFIENAQNLTIGGIDMTQTGVASIGSDIVICVEGSLTVSENVTAAGAGNVTLKTVDTLVGFETLNVDASVTVSSGTGDVMIQSGDDITLATGSSITAGGTISIESDFGDADPASGTSITINAILSSTATSVTSGIGDDTVTISYPDGATNSGTVTLNDSGGTDAVIINGTDNNDVLFLTTADPPTTATTEQVTRGDAVSEPIIIPGDFDSLRLNGGDGLDTFDVQPSMLFPVTLDGGFPSFGQPGVPPGDKLDLDPFGNSFYLTGKTLFVNGGVPDDYEGVTLINIEDAPLDPISNTTVRLDLNQQFIFGNQSPTAAGFTGVGHTTLYSDGLGYGWQTPILKGRNDTPFYTGTHKDVLGDSHIVLLDSTADSRTFTADLAANGFVLVTVGFGHYDIGVSDFLIEDGDSGLVLASGLSTEYNEIDHVSFILNVPDTTLDLVFRTQDASRRVISLTSIDIAPGNLFSMGFAPPAAPLPADGVTVDSFLLDSAPPNTAVTVETDLGTLVNTDAEPEIEGLQVLTDGAGQATIMLQRPTGAGQAVVAFSAATGEQIGCSVVEYGLLDTRLFDFDFGNVDTQAGYTSVLHTDLYSSARGHGWLSQPTALRVPVLTTGAFTSLTTDVHRFYDSGTFRVDMPNGQYEVHAYFGDGGDHEAIRVAANGSVVIPDFSIINTDVVEASFDVTISGGRLDLVLSQHDSHFGDPYWTISGLEIRPVTAIGSFTPVNLGALDADGLTTTTVTASTTAPDGTLVTVTASLGTIVSADATSSFAGTQVAVTGGQVQFDLLRPAKAGTPTVNWRAVDGSFHSTVTDSAFLEFDIPVTRRFDFNVRTSEGTSPTQAGFISVLNTDITPNDDGFGWTSFAGPIAPISGDVPGVVSDDLYRDAAFGTSATPGTFLIEARAATDYDVRVYLSPGDSIEVTVEGAGTQTFTSSTFHSVVFLEAEDVSNDGFISINITDTGGIGNKWCIEGVDIAESMPGGPGLPAVAALHAATTGSGAQVIAEDDITPLVDIVTTAFQQHLNLTTDQLATLETVNITTSNLADGLLGYAYQATEDGLFRIVLDDDGSGHGWGTSADGVAAGSYDLLTTLAHELGHAVGYEHEDASGVDDILHEVLPVGTRQSTFAGIDEFFSDTLSAGTATD